MHKATARGNFRALRSPSAPCSACMLGTTEHPVLLNTASAVHDRELCTQQDAQDGGFFRLLQEKKVATESKMNHPESLY